MHIDKFTCIENTVHEFCPTDYEHQIWKIKHSELEKKIKERKNEKREKKREQNRINTLKRRTQKQHFLWCFEPQNHEQNFMQML